ncbi:E3 ubiquitin-protein ligase MARCHF6 isoform X2 [Macaca nemestrina]|nr:E3 ubiquitin-protein ligase MARCH6 isoform X2 [Macaca nemestrina]XP_011752633.1 E3 ubiquitin-protein ligase MARCH6 isoform X2 [Macaca nemestrina]XP_011833443.1 PREDICTED: E3 ubiquitin-protein ligase MARCH6 [Mandrillus leucophaeus]XP_014995222.1 E3 ubiquitin-protein ligase MARCH6 isoform X2 [Macaca mulatta]XP_015306700.1 E3 ubiquitin-protein ligase MARCHF6 isoform X2 [Macaca fascicularis]XP_015306701.1 E3 ubiquitin-protein ligase MARCHF6 isoform X2 [Macaca fascicularis]XP_028705170.1 E3 ubi
MPSRLPIQDIFAGLVTSIGTAIRYWFHYTLVAFAWLGVVPLTACRIYKCLFTGSVSSLLTLPLDMLSTENLLADCLQGCFVVTCTLCAFISLVWLREQIVHGGAPIWLEHAAPPFNAAGHHQNEAPAGGNGAENVAADQPANPPAENAVVGENPDAQDDQAEEEEEDNEEEDDAGVEDAADANNGAQDDMNWNALEWDRAAEELTWERMLGLDGSLVFLEHVFWVVSLNTLFILVFAFCPYHIGHFSLVGLGFEEHVQASHFEGLITTIVGYILLAITLIICHGLATLVKFHRSRRLLGVCYIVVKVSLLVVVEIGVFPLICGWWLDICSLEMFDATLKDRELSFQSAPGTTMFLHWLVGMVYVFYFASFILLLREVLRPGVLWFLRNLNDPDFNPVQEMIHLPIYRHLRRFILSVIVFGSIVLLMLWLPIRIIKSVLPHFLPYNVMLYSDAPVSELSLELLLLQVVLPALLEQGHTRQWLKGLVRAWTVTAGYLLDLHSYLLGDQEENENSANQQVNNNQHARNNNAIPVVGEGLHAAHQAILQQGGPVGFQPYRRPLNFPLRIFLLIVFMCITLLIASLICLTLPVFAGRWLMSFWTGTAKIHELYTAACGLYVCWLTIRAVTVMVAWMPQGRRVIFQKVKEWSLMIMKTLIVAVLLAGVVPLLLGLLFELVIVAPLRVPLDQTPLFYPWQDWALGVLHAKIIAAITLMGPQWWLKTVIEQVYANGIRNIDLHYIVRRLAAPVISVLLLSLCVPYVIASGVVPLLGVTAEMQNLVHRRIYPFLLMVVVLMAILSFQVRQFKRLYEHIKNDKYLVGQRLVNYERKSGKQGSSPAPPQSSQE